MAKSYCTCTCIKSSKEYCVLYVKNIARLHKCIHVITIWDMSKSLLLISQIVITCIHLYNLAIFFAHNTQYSLLHMLFLFSLYALHVLFLFSPYAHASYYLYAIYYFYFTQRCLNVFYLKCFRNIGCQSLLAINSLLANFFKSLC